MSVQQKTVSFAHQIVIDRWNNPYIYGGNWDPFDRIKGTDCSGCVVDVLDAAINGTAMEWTRHGLSTEDWRPPSMGGYADPNNGPFGTKMVSDPSQFPTDAAVLIAFHHGPGGGANSHTWCQLQDLKIETKGDDGTILFDGVNYLDDVRDVHLVDRPDQYGANNWWYLPGPVKNDGTPIPHQPSGVGAAPAGEPADTLWADVSEFQSPLDDSYWKDTYTYQGTGPWPYQVICIRSNDGDHVDDNFVVNYQRAVQACNDGRCKVLIVYYYWRPGSAAVNNHMALIQAQGGPHPKMVSMIDLESGSGNPSSDVSNQVNSDYYALQQWLGNDQRVIGYANVGDRKQMWQTMPAHVPMILAGYGSNPNDPSVFKIAHQYTDGNGYGGGLPEGADPFGNCDMNSADGLSPSQLAAALGVAAPVVPDPMPTPTPTPDPPAPTPLAPYDPAGFPNVALTNQELQLMKTLVIDNNMQLRGPTHAGWPQLGKNDDGSDLTPVDALARTLEVLATIQANLATLLVAAPKAKPSKNRRKNRKKTSLNRNEGRWGNSAERFGIPNPREVMAEVDRIVETKLEAPMSDQVLQTLKLPGLSELKALAEEIDPVLEAVLKVVDFIQKHDNIPVLASLASSVDVVDKALHVLDSLVHQVID